MKIWKENSRLPFRATEAPAKRFFAVLGWACLVVGVVVGPLWVAIPMLLGRTSFLPPFITWYGAMLFAIVPLRNFLPGNPPLGSWIDQAVVLWVLIGLVVAMALFILAWWRHRDRKQPKKT